MTQAGGEPVYLCTRESILEAVGSPSADSKIISFLRSNKLFDEGKADYSASLLILTGSEQWRIRADLNASPEIEHLPQIQRTGRSSPWMRCYMLGLRGDVVTDPYLQRARCLFLTSEAAIQEWVDLLAQIFELIRLGGRITWGDLTAIGNNIYPPDDRGNKDKNQKWFGVLREIILWYVGLRGNVEGHDVSKKVLEFLQDRLGTEWEDEHPSRHYVKKRFHEHPKQRDFGDFDRYLLSNLVITLTLALGEDSFDSRHLGPVRLKRIRSTYPYNLVIQGVGDLSMNEWNVAYFKDPKVVIPENEPFGSRRYNCLVVWDEGAGPDKVKSATDYIAREEIGASLGHDISIAQLQFSKGPPYIIFPGNYPSNASLHKLVKFAVYGKLVLREGKVVEADEVIDQFQDLRHVFSMPNLNPEYDDKPLKQTVERMRDWAKSWLGKQDRPGGKQRRLIEELCHLLDGKEQAPEDLLEAANTFRQRMVIEGDPKELDNAFEDSQATLDPMSRFLMEHFLALRKMLRRPRYLFGQLQSTDVWLLESALLRDRSLRHLACTSAIAVDLADLGAPRVWIDYCLLQSDYRKQDALHQVQERGDFAWDESDHPRLIIRLKLQTYPCTIIGIGRLPATKDEKQELNALYLLAWGHVFSRGGHTIWDCAKVLREAGAKYALVMDEGQDTFLCSVPGYSRRKEEIENQEKSCGSLRKWMCVPFAFEKIQTDSGPALDKFKRRGLRATLAFWQESTTDLGQSPPSEEEHG